MSDHASQLTADHAHRPERGPTGSMEVEAFIDFICPRCYIAVRYLFEALAMFEHRDDVRIAWRSFQLDVLSGRSFDELLVVDVMRNHRMKRTDATDVAATVITKLREAAARGPRLPTGGDNAGRHLRGPSDAPTRRCTRHRRSRRGTNTECLLRARNGDR